MIERLTDEYLTYGRCDMPITAYLLESLVEYGVMPDDEYADEHGGYAVYRFGRRTLERSTGGFYTSDRHYDADEATAAAIDLAQSNGVPTTPVADARYAYNENQPERLENANDARYSFNGTDDAVASMLVEDTGTHFLDSGGENGRAWQRNAGMTPADFNQQPAVVVDGRHGWLDVTVSSFHFLNDALNYDETLTRIFYGVFIDENDDADHSWLSLSELFPKWLTENGFGYDDGGETPISFNTYNDENHLSQDFQGVVFSFNSSQYVVLQTHNGADARGGYSRPLVFELSDEWSIFDHNRFSVVCSNQPTTEQVETLFGTETVVVGCGSRWSTYYDGATLQPDDAEYVSGVSDQLTNALADANDVKLNDGVLIPIGVDVEQFKANDYFGHSRKALENGAVVVRFNEETGAVVCPICNVGNLEGWSN